jgi:hypothetical protein
MRKRAGKGPFIGKYPQHGEEIRPPLNLVDHHHSRQVSEGCHWFCQAGEAQRVFKIEIVGRIGGNDLPCQGRLAALSRAYQRDHPTPPERTSK